jgi:hypothetical protein
MRRIHVALAVSSYAAAVQEYTARLGRPPCCTVEGTYALWRTEHVNMSISVKPAESGKLRLLGFEDTDANDFGEEMDSQGFVWERFSAEDRNAEILKQWPHAKFH